MDRSKLGMGAAIAIVGLVFLNVGGTTYGDVGRVLALIGALWFVVGLVTNPTDRER